jgi:multidrug resistance efflux pump
VAKLDDREEQAALAIDADKADDTTSIKAEMAVLESKKQDLKMLDNSNRGSGGGRAVGTLEYHAAQLEVTVAEARVELANRQHKQDGLKLIQTQIAVKKLELLTPIDGIVAETFLHKGEVADGGNMKAMRVIQIDPLWVEVPVPIVQANRLKKGDTATVYFLDKPRIGKIDHIKPFNDSGSQRRVICVEVLNPEKERGLAGQVCPVDFRAPEVAKTGK